jgi:SnoaL-like domain
MTSSELARALYEAYQARDWDTAATHLHEGASVRMPHTGEHLRGRDEVIGFQHDYPEPWGTLTVDRLIGDDDAVAAQISIVDPDGRGFAMAAFWTVRDGLLDDGLELWLDLGGLGPSRYRTELAARATTPPSAGNETGRGREQGGAT